ncbi:hypothetical protein BD410DRAFT_449616 [Rickenella mellea]|uniref:F-box domain-containing protein n=1 Tax=Rickenella mellea TaxID=50990 RepID=A0A4Y7PWV0_9AGAM|nr:hypothetical protein BD410DRAFT_449616 [Rickenella mellea]
MARIGDDEPAVQFSQKSSATVQTLAPELLREIFMHCVSNDSDTDPRRSIRCLSQVPLLLGRVCRTWRVVVGTSPELWSNFTVGDRQFHHVDFEKDLEAAKHWISKSGSRPLSIAIHYPGISSYGALLPPILKFLVSQSWRWKDIKLTVPSGFEDIVLSPLAFGTRNLPQLVKFDSTITRKSSSAKFILSSAPRLQFLRHSGDGPVHVDFGGGPHKIKQIGMRRTAKGKLSLADLFTCFTHCPLLENLVIPIWQSEMPRDELPSSIELSYLTHLSLRCSEGVDPHRLFGRLFLPVLISLELFIIFSSDTDWPHLQTMLARSRPPLQNLCLRFVPMTELTLVGCLSCVPTLTELELEGIECSDTILNALTVDEFKGDVNGSKNLCPWLETIDFVNDVYSEFSRRAMKGMIISRRKNANFARGKALTLIKCQSFNFDGIRSNPDIAECLKDGLVLIGCE